MHSLLLHHTVDSEWRGIVVQILFNLPYHTILNVYYLVGLVRHTTLVSYHNNGRTLFLIQLLQQLHHLFKAQELLAMQIASIHNLAFYLRLVTDARQHIINGDFVAWKRSVIDQLGQRR